MLTQAEAAEFLGVSARSIGLRINTGSLSLYIDADEPDSRKRRRVSLLEVKAIAAEGVGQKADLPAPDDLVEEYNTDLSVTISSIADKYGVSAPTITKRMNQSAIARRDRRRRGQQAEPDD
jgi:hypothetical protein